MPGDPLSASALFSYANLVALGGWLLLAAGVALRLPILRDAIAGLCIPVALSLPYTGIVGAHWWQAQGGFSSLESVAALFQSPWMLLAGWIHYLAFDLFVGAWVARDAERRGLPRLFLVPVLPAVFLFGPAGLVLWVLVRTASRPAPLPEALREGAR